MKVYSYRNFEGSTNSKSFSKIKVPPLRGSKKKFNQSGLPFDFSFFDHQQNFAFQLVSICLLTVGLLLGFQLLTENSDVSTLASDDIDGGVRALNNFGRNIKPEDSLQLKEIAAESGEVSEEVVVENNEPETIETITYTVKAGDNLYAIAQEFGVEFTDIAEDNELTRPYNLQIGQQLYINP